jgi:uncharacterized protein YaaQ
MSRTIEEIMFQLTKMDIDGFLKDKVETLLIEAEFSGYDRAMSVVKNNKAGEDEQND